MHLFQSLSIFALITAGIAHPLFDAALPSLLSRSFDEGGQLGQFVSKDCSGKIFSDASKWLAPSGHEAAAVFNHTIDVNAYLEKGTCTAWYPVLDQYSGPSVGVNFGANAFHIKQVQFFGLTPECAAAEANNDGDYPPAVCCHKDAGGLLGVMNANGTDSDFGAVKDMGFKGSMCAQIGPGHNQTLWQMRYFISR